MDPDNHELIQQIQTYRRSACWVYAEFPDPTVGSVDLIIALSFQFAFMAVAHSPGCKTPPGKRRRDSFAGAILYAGVPLPTCYNNSNDRRGVLDNEEQSIRPVGRRSSDDGRRAETNSFF
jgi:hypothetical protein